MSDEFERRPYRLGAGEGRRLWAFGDLMILKTTAKETNGRVFVMEQHVPRHRQAPGRHVHAADDQSWFVISGHGRFFIGDETLVAGPGDFIHGPHGMPHAFSADSDDRHVLVGKQLAAHGAQRPASELEDGAGPLRDRDEQARRHCGPVKHSEAHQRLDGLNPTRLDVQVWLIDE